MPLIITSKDITCLNVGAIVNFTNQNLSEIDDAIKCAADSEKLAKACRRIGFCDVGNAVITKGYNLLSKYIIHTAMPACNNENEMLKTPWLALCYMNSLKLAKRKRISSIAVPVLSAKRSGYSHEETVNVAFDVIKGFLKENEMLIYLVVRDKDSTFESNDLYSEIYGYIEKKKTGYRLGNMPEPPVLMSLAMGVDKQLDAASGSRESVKPKKTQTTKLQDEEFQSTSRKMLSDVRFSPSARRENAPSSPRRTTTVIESIINRNSETFSQMLLRLIDSKGMTDVEVYKRANIDRKLFSKIRKKEYVPSKHTVVALIVALQLNMDEATDLLKAAGYALSNAIKFDVIIEFFIINGIYDIYKINEVLFYFDQQLLGA